MSAVPLPAAALTIAGSDPSGGAGVQADLKAFLCHGVYGCAALTALTVQDTTGVHGVHLVPPDFVADQARAVLDDIRPQAVKIGMIATADIACTVGDALVAHAHVPIVLDPVMIAKGGAPLLRDDAIDAVRTRLVPLATVITPNLPEAARLLGTTVASTRTTPPNSLRWLLAYSMAMRMSLVHEAPAWMPAVLYLLLVPWKSVMVVMVCILCGGGCVRRESRCTRVLGPHQQKNDSACRFLHESRCGPLGI